MDIILGKYAGTGFGLVLHWVILFFLAVSALYIVLTALSKILGMLSETMKNVEPAAPPAAEAVHAEHAAEAPAQDDAMNRTAAAIGLALHLTILRNSVKAITVRRVYRSSWKETRRAGVMERI